MFSVVFQFFEISSNFLDAKGKSHPITGDASEREKTPCNS